MSRAISTHNDLCVQVMQTGYADNLPLTKIASALTDLGYTSKTKLKLTESHISNFGKELGLRKMPVRARRYYGEINHEVARQAQELGLWPIKVRIDNADKKGEAIVLQTSDWQQIMKQGIDWVERFHKYVIRLSTT